MHKRLLYGYLNKENKMENKQRTPLALAIERIKTLQNLYEKETPQHNSFGIAINELESLKPKEREMFEEFADLGYEYLNEISAKTIFDTNLTQE